MALAAVLLIVIAIVIAVALMRRRASRDEQAQAEESRVTGNGDANVLEFGDDMDMSKVAEEAQAPVPEDDEALKALREYEPVSEAVRQPDELDDYILEVESSALDPETGPHDEEAIGGMRADLEKRHKEGKIGEDAYKEMRNALDEM